MSSDHTNIIIPKYNLNYTIAKNKNIIEASLEKNIKLAYSCKSGICGTCKAKIISGEIQKNNKINHILTKSEIDNNIILLCQSSTLSNSITIEPLAPMPRKIELSKVREIVSEVLSIKNINKNIIELSISVPKRFFYDKKNLNYIKLLIPGKNIKKYYIFDTINHDEAINGSINVLIDKNEDNDIKKYLNKSLIIGETITIKGPYERNINNIPNNKPLLFITEDNHIISSLNIIKSLIYNNNIPIMLICSFKNKEDIILLDELHKIQFTYKNFSYKISLIYNKDTNNLNRFKTGKTSNIINKILPDLSNHYVYIKGNLDFLNENYKKVEDLGAKKENIYNKN